MRYIISTTREVNHPITCIFPLSDLLLGSVFIFSKLSSWDGFPRYIVTFFSPFPTVYSRGFAECRGGFQEKVKTPRGEAHQVLRAFTNLFFAEEYGSRWMNDCPAFAISFPSDVPTDLFIFLFIYYAFRFYFFSSSQENFMVLFFLTVRFYKNGLEFRPFISMFVG